METLLAGGPIHTRLPRHGWVADSLIESNSWSSSPSPLLDLSVALPRFHYIQVPHVRQLYNWDCGLACVLMVLRSVGIDGCDLISLAKLCSTTSIWTIDLAHLLRRFTVNVSFLTVTIGANPSFAVESFYQVDVQENMEEDGERVNRLFEQAPEVGIQIQVTTFCPNSESESDEARFYDSVAVNQWRRALYADFVRQIPGHCIGGQAEAKVALMLVGDYGLYMSQPVASSHPWLDDICLADCCGSPNSGYTGHYVVICGYDLDTDEFEIRDPASSSGSGRISLDALDEARKSFGTDEDILFVSLHDFDPESAGMAMLSSSSSENSL